MLTHSNLVTSVRQVRSGLRVTGRDTMLAVVPFFHDMGFVVNLAVLAVPPVMAVPARHPLADAHNLSSLEMIVSGGRRSAPASSAPWLPDSRTLPSGRPGG